MKTQKWTSIGKIKQIIGRQHPKPFLTLPIGEGTKPPITIITKKEAHKIYVPFVMNVYTSLLYHYYIYDTTEGD